jgi:hypothetical protein
MEPVRDRVSSLPTDKPEGVVELIVSIFPKITTEGRYLLRERREGKEAQSVAAETADRQKGESDARVSVESGSSESVI